MNKIVSIGIIGLATYGVYRLMGMKTLYDKMGTALYNPRIHKLDAKGIAFRSEIKIINPTKFTMTISKPVIKITTNGKPIGQNSPEQKVYDIKPQANTIIDTIEIVVPWTAFPNYLVTIAAKIPTLIKLKTYTLKSIMETLKVPLEMQYELYVGKFYYQSPIQKLV